MAEPFTYEKLVVFRGSPSKSIPLRMIHGWLTHTLELLTCMRTMPEPKAIPELKSVVPLKTQKGVAPPFGM